MSDRRLLNGWQRLGIVLSVVWAIGGVMWLVTSNKNPSYSNLATCMYETDTDKSVCERLLDIENGEVVAAQHSCFRTDPNRLADRLYARRRRALDKTRVQSIMTDRRFPAPWTVEKIPGGFKVCDAQGQSLAYVYSRESAADAGVAGVLTEDEARRIASDIAKLPALLGAAGHSDWDFPEGGG